MSQRRPGFTVVELLIVIVIIAVLAVISVVAYNGIQRRAQASTASNALSQVSRKIKTWQVEQSGQSPTSLADVGVQDSASVKYQYRIGSTDGTYCVTATAGTVSYRLTELGNPTEGACAGHGSGGIAAVTNLALNPNASGASGWAVGGAVGGAFATGFDGATSSYRMTRSATGAAVMRAGTSSAINPNAEYTIIISLRSNISTPVTVQLRGTTSSNDASNFQGVNLIANQSQIIKATGTSWNGSHTAPAVAVTWSSGVSGDWVEATRVMVVQGTYSGNYADGTSPSWIWDGTANASTSTGPPQ